MGSCIAKATNQVKLQNDIERIDHALSVYYESCCRNDYYDKKGQGKFRIFVEQIGFDKYDIYKALSDDVSTSDCLLIDMDCNFPLAILVCDEEYVIRNEAIFTIIKYCYKHGKAPSHQWLRIERRKRLLMEMDPLYTTETMKTEEKLFVLTGGHGNLLADQENNDASNSVGLILFSLLGVVVGTLKYSLYNDIYQNMMDKAIAASKHPNLVHFIYGAFVFPCITSIFAAYLLLGIENSIIAVVLFILFMLLFGSTLLKQKRLISKKK